MNMTNEEIFKKLNSTILCLMAHPDNEPGSEFADRIDDLIDIQAYHQQPQPIISDTEISKINLPSNEEIIKEAKFLGLDDDDTKIWEFGAKWLRDKIQSTAKESPWISVETPPINLDENKTYEYLVTVENVTGFFVKTAEYFFNDENWIWLIDKHHSYEEYVVYWQSLPEPSKHP